MRLALPSKRVTESATTAHHDASQQATRRTFADAALEFISAGGLADDGGSDEFHLICGIQHRFATRVDPMDDEVGGILLQGAIAIALGLLSAREDDDAVGARLSLERIADSAGMTPMNIRATLGMAVAEQHDPVQLSGLLLDHK